MCCIRLPQSFSTLESLGCRCRHQHLCSRSLNIQHETALRRLWLFSSIAPSVFPSWTYFMGFTNTCLEVFVVCSLIECGKLSQPSWLFAAEEQATTQRNTDVVYSSKHIIAYLSHSYSRHSFWCQTCAGSSAGNNRFGRRIDSAVRIEFPSSSIRLVVYQESRWQQCC